MTDAELIKLARKAGFDKWDDSCLSGEDMGDEILSVGEYPVGNMVRKLVKAVERVITERCGG